MWLGLPQLVIFPFVPLAMRHIDPRVIVGFGLALFAVSCFMNAFLTHDWAIQQLRWSQLVRAAGQPFVITPLSALAAGGQPEREQAGASAIFNIMRNLGGSVGIAMLSTFITFREQYHFSIIGDRLTQNSIAVAARIAAITRMLGPKTSAGTPTAHMQALAELANMVRREAFVMAYSDCFFIIGIALALSILALFLTKAPPESGQTTAG